MDELTLDGKIYISSKRAAKITGYAKDYVGQLCREGRVEARLVGRNWYILEDSIREHRFGVAEKINVPADAVEETEIQPEIVTEREKEQETEPEHAIDPIAAAVESTQYISEIVPELPIVDKQTPYATYKPIEPPIEAVTSAYGEQQEQSEPFSDAQTDENTVRDTSAIVKEMESAWKDWFSRKDEQRIVEETLIESPEIIDTREHFEPVAQEEEVVPLKKVVEEAQRPAISPVEAEEEESVPIHRSYVRSESKQESMAARTTISTPVKYDAPLTRTPMPVRSTGKRSRRRHDQVIIRERSGGSSIVLRAIFVALILVTIAVTVISSGYLDQYLSKASVIRYALQYLGGERVINK